jgi:hypothetical protein
MVRSFLLALAVAGATSPLAAPPLSVRVATAMQHSRNFQLRPRAAQAISMTGY